MLLREKNVELFERNEFILLSLLQKDLYFFFVMISDIKIMECRPLVTEENDPPEGHESPYLQFETQEDENSSEKRTKSTLFQTNK